MNRTKRFFAFLIDLIICNIPFVVADIAYSNFIANNLEASIAIKFNFLGLAFIFAVSAVLLIFRDVIIGERSFGKKLFGLRIIDRDTCFIASKKQRILNNLFVLALPFDLLFLLLFKRSLGNIFTRTQTISNIEF